MHGVFSRRHEYLIQDIRSLLPEPEIFTQNCPGFCFASFCPLFCWTSVCWDLQPHVPPQYWWLLRLVVKYPSYTFLPLCSHLERGMMSSLWYVICLISPGKNEEMCLMLSIHSRVLTQHEAARSGLPTLAGPIYLRHHTALWEDFNSHCLLSGKNNQSHSQIFIPLCPSPSLESHFCAFKGELFFCFPFIPAERWPLFCFSGIRAFLPQLLPPGQRPTLSSELTLNVVYFSLSYLFHSLPFLQAGPLLINLSLSPFPFQFSLFCSAGSGVRETRLPWRDLLTLFFSDFLILLFLCQGGQASSDLG